MTCRITGAERPGRMRALCVVAGLGVLGGCSGRVSERALLDDAPASSPGSEGALSAPPAPAVEVEQIAEGLMPALDRKGGEVVSLAGGATRARLRGTHKTAIVARQRADGSLEASCVDTPEQVRSVLSRPVVRRAAVTQ